MIRIFLLFFVLFSFNGLPGESSSDLTLLGLRGNICKLKEYYYSSVSGNLFKTKAILFNKWGNQTENNEADSSGNIVSKSVFEYSDDLLRERKWYGPDNKMISRTICIYDQNSRQTERKNINADGLMISKTSYYYTREGYLSSFDAFTPDGNIYNHHEYKYDSAGRETGEIISYPDGAVEWRSESHYDDKGNLSEKHEYPSCCLSIKYSYLYDESGNLTSENSIKGDGSQGISYRFSYVYDEKGNWLIKRIYENNNPTIQIKREIQYY